MADLADSLEEPTDPLRLDRCPDCGYLLHGLPGRGVCPECGFAYDSAMIVLYGWEKGSGAGRRAAWRGRLLGLLPYTWLMFLLAALWHPSAGGPGWPASPWNAILLLGAFVPIGVSLWRRRSPKIPGPAPLQLRMTPAGFALRDGIGPAELRPWQGSMGVGFEPLGPDRQLLYSEHNGQRVAWWEGLEVGCDAQAAYRIRHRVARWCSAARASTQEGG